MESFFSFIFSYHEYRCLDNIALHRSASSIHCSYSGMNRQREEDGWRRRGEEERWRRKRWRWWWWWWSCPVMQGEGRWWRTEILPPFPSIHPWSSLAERCQNEGWSLVSRQRNSEHFPPSSLKPLDYTYIVHARVGLNSLSLWGRPMAHFHCMVWYESTQLVLFWFSISKSWYFFPVEVPISLSQY